MEWREADSHQLLSPFCRWIDFSGLAIDSVTNAVNRFGVRIFEDYFLGLVSGDVLTYDAQSSVWQRQ